MELALIQVERVLTLTDRILGPDGVLTRSRTTGAVTLLVMLCLLVMVIYSLA
jgi:hypothetical protein